MLNKIKRFLVGQCLNWKYRNVDPDLCCCGGMISKASPYDSICAHGGCRSLKEFTISQNLPKMHQYKYPRPAVTVDTVIFNVSSLFVKTFPATWKVLLIRRKKDPFGGYWALPGGFLEESEDLKCGAARELMEETGIIINSSDLRDLGAYGKPGRDPRGHTISVAFIGSTDLEPTPGSDAVEAAWFSKQQLPSLRLAFDHRTIISDAVAKLGI